MFLAFGLIRAFPSTSVPHFLHGDDPSLPGPGREVLLMSGDCRAALPPLASFILSGAAWGRSRTEGVGKIGWRLPPRRVFFPLPRLSAPLLFVFFSLEAGRTGG